MAVVRSHVTVGPVLKKVSSVFYVSAADQASEISVESHLDLQMKCEVRLMCMWSHPLPKLVWC